MSNAEASASPPAATPMVPATTPVVAVTAPPVIPAPPASKPVSRKKNAVQIDGVLKEQVNLEKQAISSWEQKWSFLKDVHTVCIEEAAKEGISEKEFVKLRLAKKGLKLPKTDNWFPKPSNAFPTTSSGVIGWRSANADCSVERFGPLYISPRHTMSPPDRPDTPPQKCIILG